jgi:hypothetical protein
LGLKIDRDFAGVQPLGAEHRGFAKSGSSALDALKKAAEAWTPALANDA